MMCHIFVDIVGDDWRFCVLHIYLFLSFSYLSHLSFYERYWWSGFVVVIADRQ
jgi:hypothetical protein